MKQTGLYLTSILCIFQSCLATDGLIEPQDFVSVTEITLKTPAIAAEILESENLVSYLNTPLAQSNPSIDFQATVTLPPQNSEIKNISEKPTTNFAPSNISFDPQQPIVPPSRKSAALAGFLGMITPGLGHVYLEEYAQAGKLFGTACGMSSLAAISQNPVMDSSLMTCLFYSPYAAYRDARRYNGFTDYRHPMANEDISDLIKAPFQWSVIKKPQVWGGLALALSLAMSISYASDGASIKNTPELKIHNRDIHLISSPLSAFPVGIGEEAFFRGYLQTNLLEILPPPVAIATASTIFGLAHWGNANGLSKKDQFHYRTVIIPFISTFGAYFGYLNYKNQSLKECVALHAWYDFTLFSLGAISHYVMPSDASISKDTSFSTSFEF